ncbi:MAG: hypothetical protein CSA65_04425 [Proteobacteria bacterium]|nr:MAG: hypothetical protein CSA65_04425 [Pseudomonadota bacterium]
MTRLVPGIAFCIALMSAPATSLAAPTDKVACTVRAMHGLEVAGEIDKRLKALEKKLKRPPFSPYKRIQLLQAKKLTIAQSGYQQTALPDGKVLKLTFKEKLLLKGRLRVRMHLELTEPKSKKLLARTVYSIADGGTFLVAGAKYKGGIMIIGITCKAR